MRATLKTAKKKRKPALKLRVLSETIADHKGWRVRTYSKGGKPGRWRWLT